MPKSRQEPRRPERKVLVVDDNPAVVRLIGTLFEEEGMIVRLAESVKDAKVWLDSGETFDLVLSDISMPVETGFDLLQWIKQPGSPHAELPVLLTTAQLPEAENRLKGLAMGAVDYVVRPIELKELVLRSINAIEHFQRVRALEATLQSAESLAMAGRLLAASSHEIKNLAALVKLSADQTVRAFAAKAAPGSMEATMLASLKESSGLLADVARSVMTLLDPGDAAVRPVCVSKLGASVVALMRTRVKPCRIELVGGDSDAWVEAHDVRVKQVLINLILNANDAIEELAPDEGGRIVVRIDTAAEHVRILVVDNGIGLSAPGERSEFKAFATTKKLRGGTGLGLWLCSRIMSNMSGSVTLRSEGVGRGATAAVTLPRATAPLSTDDIDLAKYFVDD